PRSQSDEDISSLSTEEIIALSQSKVEKVETDTLPKRILFIGDSMLEGLYPRLAAYAKANGHSLYCVIWYSSTSKVWGESTHIPEYIKQFDPDYVFISLGANELFVKDIEKQRDKYVKKILSEIDPIPYVWIGPPNWKEDTGINRLIASNAAPGTFFLSNGMHFDRKSDGAHPTSASAALWMDSIVRWMPKHCAHPIKMDMPSEKSARANRVVVLQPTDK
ncbi:MAG: SGNH/GDSL hydrolase family protein, partial [Muribaculaceae bacterium]|nr:SGNH/GDSL hydrolase family protein [Muribaculaceae bacterium]